MKNEINKELGSKGKETAIQQFFYPCLYFLSKEDLWRFSFEKTFKYILKPEYGIILARKLEFHFQGLIFFQIKKCFFSWEFMTLLILQHICNISK